MTRPRIPIGGYGEISFVHRSKGKVEARTRFRDWDGQTRLVQATAGSRAAAEAELKKRLTQRNAFQPVDTALTPESPFPALVEYWLADLDLEGRIAPATRFNYERDMRRLVLPAFKGFTLREIGVARCDALLKQLGTNSYSSAKRARTVLRQSFALAVRHEVLPRNPIDNVSRLHKPKRTPTALTSAEVNAIRAVIKAWEQSRGTSGPNPDGQLRQIVEVMLGTSARIGEVLAIRRRDLDLTTTPATLRICGTVISERGCRHLSAGASEDRPLQPGDRPTVVHRRGAAPPDRPHAGPLARRAGVLQPPGHAADDGQCATPAPEGPRRRRHRGRHAAHVPADRRHRGERGGEPEPRLRVARPHRPEGDGRATTSGATSR